MIYILSMMVLLSFILSGIFVGLAPSSYQIMKSDFLRRASANAKFKGIQEGNLMLRAKNTTPRTTVYPLIYKDGNLTKQIQTNVSISGTTITVRVDVGE